MDPDQKELMDTSFVTNRTFAAAMSAIGMDDSEKTKEKKALAKAPASGQKKFGE